MASSVRDVDHGYASLLKRVFGFKKPRIDVGILEAAGGKEHEGGEGTSVLDVGVWNEFGTNRIPARSFVRAWFDQAEGKMREELAKLARTVVAGARTKEQLLELLGLQAAGGMQARIAEGISPANAPSTVARKGSSKPLVEKGQLRSSLSYRVDPDGGGGKR